MRTEIKYADSFPFSGQPTPFVGRVKTNIFEGERWGAQEEWSLVGQLTGCSFEDLTTAQINLINSFSRDYQSLEIIEGATDERILVSGAGSSGFNGFYFKSSSTLYINESNSDYRLTYVSDRWRFYFGTFIPMVQYESQTVDSGVGPANLSYEDIGLVHSLPPPTVSNAGESIVVERADFVEIDSINFNSSSYVKILPYTINLRCYPSGFFSGNYGILDPSDTWELTENRDLSLTITHNISARGFNTSSGQSNALENARQFVHSRTGFSNFPTPEFITKYSASGIITTQNEQINRLEGIYGVTESFILDQSDTCNYGFLRYTVESEEPQAGLTSVSINGTIQGGLNDDFQQLRDRLNSFDFYSNALYALNSGVQLNPIPVSKQITEDESRKIITFDYSFDDNSRLDTNFDYALSINSGDSNIGVTIAGNVNGRGELKDRFEKAESYFKNYFQPSIFSLAYSGYSGYLSENGITGQLNPRELSSSLSYDRFNGVISFSYEYNDGPIAPVTGLQSFDYTLSWTPPLRQIKAEELIYQSGSVLSPKYEITDLGFATRGLFSINGSAITDRELGATGNLTDQEVENALKVVYYNNFTGFSGVNLVGYSLGRTNQGNYSFGIESSYDYLDVLGNTGNYSEIINL